MRWRCRSTEARDDGAAIRTDARLTSPRIRHDFMKERHESGVAGETWRALFQRPDGALRAVWRLALFFAAFWGFAILAQLLLVALAGPPDPASRWLLVAQGGVMLAAALAAGSLLLRFAERRPAGALGIAWVHGTGEQAAVGFAVGAGALALAVAALVAAGGLRYQATGGGAVELIGALGAAAVFLAVPAAAEEALFRGYPFQVVSEALGPAIATVAFSFLFAAAHAFNPNVGTFGLVNIFLAGVLLSIVYLRTRSLWCATGVHLGWNWAMAAPFALPVSGLTGLVDEHAYRPVDVGPAWLTGGGFGPEGGLAGTVAFLAATAAALVLPTFRERPGMWRLGPIVDRRVTTEPRGLDGLFLGPPPAEAAQRTEGSTA